MEPPSDYNTSVNESCLGQWGIYPFLFDGNIKYQSTEHFMMAEKARFFNDTQTEKLILNSEHPHEVQQLGRKVKNFHQEDWDRVKYNIVLQGNYLKFSQNKELREYLISTQNKILVEASPQDKIWGIGLKKEDKKSKNPKNWQGLNLVYKNIDLIKGILS